MTCAKHVQKAFFDGTFMRSTSFLVCAHLTTCVRAHTRTA